MWNFAFSREGQETQTLGTDKQQRHKGAQCTDIGVMSLNVPENNNTVCLCSVTNNKNVFKVSNIRLSDTFNPTRIVILNFETWWKDQYTSGATYRGGARRGGRTTGKFSPRVPVHLRHINVHECLLLSPILSFIREWMGVWRSLSALQSVPLRMRLSMSFTRR